MTIRIEIGRPKSPVHIIWGVFALGTIAMGKMLENYLTVLPACAFKEATGVPCLTCGGTRSVVALANFRLIQAFASNPLIILFMTGLIVFSLLVGLALIFKRRFSIRLTSGESRLARIIVVAGVMANWAYLIISLR